MGSTRAVTTAVAVAAALALALAPETGDGASAVATAADRPLRTAFFPQQFDAAAARSMRDAGASLSRITVSWSKVAPAAAQRPAGFVATDPDSPLYRWEAVDRVVRTMDAAGLAVMLCIIDAPVWTQGRGPRPNGGGFRPRPQELGDFAYAAARRYSGTTRELPRVRYWQAWNEPNLSYYLNPQVVAGRPVSASWYRAMVNAFSRGVHRVHRSNVVVAGGLAPLARVASESVRPLAFMRAMLCVSRSGKPTCPARTRFDVWSHHPYTTGGPQHRAFHRDDVVLGNLSKMRNLLVTAYRSGRIASPRQPGFWVTEFSWDSKPPDPRGLPLDLHARWVSEALYRMWSAGVSLVTWFSIVDQPYGASPFQSGLYFAGLRPKPARQAFRFPFVAFRQRDGTVRTWGRTPSSDRRSIVIQQRTRTGWRRLTMVRANRFGIFSVRVRTRAGSPLRAALSGGTGEASLPFSLVVPPDRFVRPFG